MTTHKSLFRMLLPVTGLVLILSSCGKDDEPPIITINGDGTVDVSLNGTYTDAGATASDNEDGDLPVSSNFSSSNPDVNKTGSYSITYTATDSEGNTATASRTVNVANDADFLIGTYGCVPLPPDPVWSQSVSTSDTENNKIMFSYFANYSGNSNITAKVVSSGGDMYISLNPNVQQANGIGSTGCDHIFTNNGNGMKVQQTGGKWTFSIKYLDERLAGGTCTSTTADPYEDTFLQQ